MLLRIRDLARVVQSLQQVEAAAIDLKMCYKL